MKAGARKRALVVEDEPLIRMTICDMLEELEVGFVEAESGRDALERLKGDADIAVLIVDLGLPDMSGEELVTSARRLRSDIRIVVASGRSAEAVGGKPAFEGVVYLEKPFDVDQLARAIEAA